MDASNVAKLVSNLIRVWDKKTGDDLNLSAIRIEKRKDHETKPEIFRFIHGDCVYNRKNSVMIHYKCITCARENTCALNNVVQRVNKGHLWCNMCKDFLDEPDQTIKSKVLEDAQEFESMPGDFKDKYFKKNLVEEEFERFRPWILSMQKGRISSFGGYKYIQAACMNEGRHNFAPYLYDTSRDVVEKICDIKLRCEQCGDVFVSKDFKRHKGRSRMLCLLCTANLPFCIKDKPHENLEGVNVSYKTRYEAKFLRFCNKHNMVVVNGPEVVYNYVTPEKEYEFTYRIPFFIKKLGLLVDVKDNHAWRREEDDNPEKTVCRKAVIQNLIVENPDMFKEYVVLYPGNYVDRTRKMVVSNNEVTSFRAWRKHLKAKKMEARSSSHHVEIPLQRVGVCVPEHGFIPEPYNPGALD